MLRDVTVLLLDSMVTGIASVVPLGVELLLNPPEVILMLVLELLAFPYEGTPASTVGAIAGNLFEPGPLGALVISVNSLLAVEAREKSVFSWS